MARVSGSRLNAEAPMSTVAIIINHAAGSAQAIDATQIADRLRSSGMQVSVTLARNGSEIIDSAKRAHGDGAEIVVAGGGDGTINAVASVLTGTATTLGVLPLGTLNHFAKALHIPLELDQAVMAIVAGHRVAVDVGEVNGKIFLNNSSIGIYPDIVQERETEQHRFGKSKWVAFFWAGMKSLRRYPFLDVKLDVDGRNLTRHTPFVFVGNNEYAIEGFDLGERKTLNAGKLSLYVSQRTGRLGLAGFALRALFGRLRQARDFDALLATEIVIETRRRRIRVATDGEVVMMDAPLHYRIRAGALNVIVPIPASD
jgi:YegS/Rv2252/BmrU family lipid kinase